MKRNIAFATALSLCAIAQQACAPDGKTAERKTGAAHAKAYAAPQREEDVCRGTTYAKIMAMNKGRSLFLWDYGIDVRQGDTLWGIAKETRANPLRWMEIRGYNVEEGVFAKGFDPARDLQPDTHILVYLPPGAADCYAKEHPERHMTYWSHGPNGECGSAAPRESAPMPSRGSQANGGQP